MNKDQIEGATKFVVGRMQETAGNLIGNHGQVVRGIEKQVAGRSQKARGDVNATIERYKRTRPTEH